MAVSETSSSAPALSKLPAVGVGEAVLALWVVDAALIECAFRWQFSETPSSAPALPGFLLLVVVVAVVAAAWLPVDTRRKSSWGSLGTRVKSFVKKYECQSFWLII